jgi:hypothetical protein
VKDDLVEESYGQYQYVERMRGVMVIMANVII